MSPFLNLPRAVFPGEITVLAAKVTSIEIVLSRVAYHLVIGLDSGNTIESPAYEPTEKNLAVLREYRDTVVDDLAEKLAVALKPEYAPLPSVGAK